MADIFISYRREDTSHVAGRLAGVLNEHKVFKDIDTLGSASCRLVGDAKQLNEAMCSPATHRASRGRSSDTGKFFQFNPVFRDLAVILLNQHFT